MPTREQIWEAADRVLAEGRVTVSNKTVLAELRRPGGPGDPPPVGGSERTVGPHLRDWKVARAYKPRLDVTELPSSLRNELDRFAANVWSMATGEAVARLDDARRKLAAEAKANDDLRFEAMVETEAAQAEAATMRSENAALREEIGRLRNRLDHIRSEDFWDRVMQEAYEILPPTGTMSVAEIMTALPSTTLRAGRLVKEPFSEGMMRKKMNVRAERSRYFAKLDEDAYGRLPGWNGALGKHVPGT